MILLPVIDRELRVASRRAATYRTRLWSGVAATLLLAWANLVFSWQGQSRAGLGQALFFTLSGLAFLYCLMIGARITADCISEEKREGTLGLLFLTDLKGRDVVLGKFVANSLNSFYGLLGILPLLAIPLLLGGVTFGQVGQMALVLINSLFFSLSMGVFVSTISRNDRKAMFATLLLVLGLTCAPIVAALYWIFVAERVQSVADFRFLALVIFPTTPICALGYVLWPSLSTALRIPWAPPSWSFWCSLAVVHLAGWMALIVATRLLPLIWKDRPSERRARGWRSFLKVRGKELLEEKSWRAKLLETNPYLWLGLRDRWKVIYPWLFLIGVSATWIWGYYRYRDVMFDVYPAVPTALMIHGFLKLWILSEASHRFVEDHRNGSLEMVLSSPVSARTILHGQFLALRRQFVLPLLALALLEAAVFRGWFSWPVILCFLVMFAVDAITLCWVGLYLSLSGKNMNRLMWISSALVMVLPWAVYGLSLGFWNMWFSGDRYQRVVFGSRVGLWFAIGLLTDCFLVFGWARPRLKNHFRALALRQFERSSTKKQSWFPSLGWRRSKEIMTSDQAARSGAQPGFSDLS